MIKNALPARIININPTEQFVSIYKVAIWAVLLILKEYVLLVLLSMCLVLFAL